MKKGCGMKMAKGGSVKKMSPRKAMAMGKKPSGGKSGVKKFAAGGAVNSLISSVTPQQMTASRMANNAALQAAYKANPASFNGQPRTEAQGNRMIAAGGAVMGRRDPLDKNLRPEFNGGAMPRRDPLDKNLRPEFNGGAMPRRPVTGGPLILPNRPIRGQEIMPGTMPPTKSGLGRISVNPVRRAFAKGGSVKKGCKK